MEWWTWLMIICIGLVILLATGIPVAFAFGILNSIILLILNNGDPGMLRLVAISCYDSVSSFVYITVPLFILMGEIIAQTGLASLAVGAIDNFIGRVPGRLGVLTVLTGTAFATASGSSMGSVATIGSTMLPEMFDSGYSRSLAIGCVVTSGALSVLIPPSAIMVIFGGIARMSVGQLLIAGIAPGLILAVSLLSFIMVYAKLHPEAAPPYKNKTISRSQRIASLINFFPILVLVFSVLGSIFFGIATPTEAAALGAFASCVLGAAYGRLKAENLKSALLNTVRVGGMTLFIITAAQVFSQILAYTGAASGLTQFVVELAIPPTAIVVGLIVVVLIMGCLMDPVSIMLVSIPIFLPIVKSLNLNQLWFAILMMTTIELGYITPPFGLNLFVIKAICPVQVRTVEVYRGVIPFIAIEMVVLAVMTAFPILITWLPGLMYG
jgi:tripartite ATP-independent transporter DctM subunit